jgi:predicted amidophosphoribosyltransferase
MLDPQRLDPPPAGLPDCGACAYLTAGTPAICLACATSDGPPSLAPTCKWCSQGLADDGSCPNTVCNFEDRQFSQIHTVSECAEEMWTAICRYKYDEDRRWADVLGRILAGYLEQNRTVMEGYDLITNGALYVGPRANRLWHHLRPILEAVQRDAPGWPVVPDLIAKAGPTGQFLGRSVETRQKIAEYSLRPALSVPQPDLVAGRRILVLDDVYSEGFSMREMARSLLQAGAAEVAGIVFARRKGG